MVFHIKKTRIEIDFPFFLMLALSVLLQQSNVLWVVLYASLHEAGHIVSLLLFGGSVTELKLSFYGIGMKHHARLGRGQECLFLLSGAAVNALCLLLHLGTDINAALLVINILPVFPLDGGRILALFAPYRVCRAVSLFVLLLLLTVGLAFRQISLLMIGAYMIVFSVKEEFTC